MNGKRELLCKPKRLLKLFDILHYHWNNSLSTTNIGAQLFNNNSDTNNSVDQNVDSYDSVTHIQRLKDLFLAVYTELPVPDQDLVAMEIHKTNNESVTRIFGSETKENTTNLFNKISSELDPLVCMSTFRKKGNNMFLSAIEIFCTTIYGLDGIFVVVDIFTS